MACEPQSRLGDGAQSTPVAIVGMSCIFPQAKDLQAFWENILSGVDAISTPASAWEAERYLKSGKISTEKGGYLKELYRFNTGGSMTAGVVTYAVAGKQYVAAASGKGSYYIGGRGSPTVVVFSLPAD